MRRILILSTVVLGLTRGASAQMPSPGAAIGSVLDRWVTKIEQLTIPAADALPEPSYGFRPTDGQFGGVRTFAEQVTHLAAANYQLAAKALGETPPAGTQNETAPASIKTKSDIMAYLRGSFAALHRAARRVDARNVEDPISVGTETESAAGLIVDALTHAQNHYGQVVVYLRMNGIVPPASR